MTQVIIMPLSDTESRIYMDGEHVGDVYHQADVLDGNPAHVVHLHEDPHGWERVRNRTDVLAAAAQRIESHLYWG